MISKTYSAGAFFISPWHQSSVQLPRLPFIDEVGILDTDDKGDRYGHNVEWNRREVEPSMTGLVQNQRSGSGWDDKITENVV